MEQLTGSLGKYRLIKRIGRGGNGEVWRAVGPNGDVAIKMLKKSPPRDATPRFQRELETLDQLSGVEGVLPILDSNQGANDAAKIWFSMPIATVLQEKLGGDTAIREICRAFAALARALARVHSRGIAHRDIKPDNLYWHDDAWCLGDFGLVQLPNAPPLTDPVRKLGPAYFIAPEMLNGPATADGRAADVYSLGKSLWVVASGQRYPLPGVHDPNAATCSIRTYRSDCPASLDELLHRMSMTEPERRPSANQVAEELNVLVEDNVAIQQSDPSETLEGLRIALAPQFRRERNKAEQEESAGFCAETLAEAARRVIELIGTATGLPAEPWLNVPAYWGYHPHLAGPAVLWENSGGFSIEAGARDLTWLMSVGYKAQLLSDSELRLHAGYHFDKLLNGRLANTMGMPQGWADGGKAPNGLPSAIHLADRLAAGLQDNLQSMAAMLTELLEDTSR